MIVRVTISHGGPAGNRIVGAIIAKALREAGINVDKIDGVKPAGVDKALQECTQPNSTVVILGMQK